MTLNEVIAVLEARRGETHQHCSVMFEVDVHRDRTKARWQIYDSSLADCYYEAPALDDAYKAWITAAEEDRGVEQAASVVEQAEELLKEHMR